MGGGVLVTPPRRTAETGDMEVVLVQMNVKDWLLLSQWRREIGAQGREAIKRGK